MQLGLRVVFNMAIPLLVLIFIAVALKEKQ
jgi:hypothetical protein